MKLKCNTCDGIFDTVDIRFTKKCDNDCSFCIEKKSSVEALETNIDAIFETFKKTGSKEVLILGGEPFLEIDKLFLLCKKLKQINTKIYITTSLPEIINKRWKIFYEIMKTVTGLNITVHHYDYIKNNKCFHASDNYNRLILTEKIIKNFPNKIRICLTLSKYYINSYYHLNNALKIMKILGAKKIKINELSHSKEYISFEKITGIKMKSPYAHGCYTKVFEKEFPGMNIELKRSCFITEETLTATFLDFIKVCLNKFFIKPLKNKFCVIYENGKKYNNWRTK